MNYLLPLQDDLDHAIDYLISHHTQEISTRHAERLRSEFAHLVDSATQEKAARHPGSTATSIDQWSYPGNAIEALINQPEREAVGPSQPSSTNCGTVEITATRPRKPQKSRNRTWEVQTDSGVLRISLPHAQQSSRGPNDVDEVGVSYTLVQNRSSLLIDARFLRELCYVSQPRVHAQLYVFTQVCYQDIIFIYNELFEHGTLAEIDDALRAGTISPFHVDEEGDNMCLFVSGLLHVKCMRVTSSS